MNDAKVEDLYTFKLEEYKDLKAKIEALELELQALSFEITLRKLEVRK